MVYEILKSLIKLYARSPFSIPRAIMGQVEELNKCVQDVEEKRKKALEKQKINKPSKWKGPYITSWEPDDRYADDNFYVRELERCYRKYKRLELIWPVKQ